MNISVHKAVLFLFLYKNIGRGDGFSILLLMGKKYEHFCGFSITKLFSVTYFHCPKTISNLVWINVDLSRNSCTLDSCFLSLSLSKLGVIKRYWSLS